MIADLIVAGQVMLYWTAILVMLTVCMAIFATVIVSLVIATDPVFNTLEKFITGGKHDKEAEG